MAMVGIMRRETNTKKLVVQTLDLDLALLVGQFEHRQGLSWKNCSEVQLRQTHDFQLLSCWP